LYYKASQKPTKENKMTPSAFYKKYLDSDRQRIVNMCQACGTSFANFQQIATAKGSVGRTLAKRLAAASDGEMTILEILYPEDYQDDDAA